MSNTRTDREVFADRMDSAASVIHFGIVFDGVTPDLTPGTVCIWDQPEYVFITDGDSFAAYGEEYGSTPSGDHDALHVIVLSDLPVSRRSLTEVHDLASFLRCSVYGMRGGRLADHAVITSPVDWSEEDRVVSLFA